MDVRDFFLKEKINNVEETDQKKETVSAEISDVPDDQLNKSLEVFRDVLKQFKE